jgi:2-iminobutanoate/2-iminopropanoate deaminase
MKRLIPTIVVFACFSFPVSSQTAPGKNTGAKKKVATSRRTVQTGKPPQNAVFSPAIVAGELVFTSGQIGIDPKTGQMVDGGFEAQAEQVLRNLAGVLEAAGSDMSQVLKTTVFLADMENYDKLNEIYRQHFKEDPPARSTVQVARLPRNAMIEIEAVALVKQ